MSRVTHAFLFITTTIVRCCPSQHPPHVNNNRLGGWDTRYVSISSLTTCTPSRSMSTATASRVTTLATATIGTISTGPNANADANAHPSPNMNGKPNTETTTRPNHDTTWAAAMYAMRQRTALQLTTSAEITRTQYRGGDMRQDHQPSSTSKGLSRRSGGDPFSPDGVPTSVPSYFYVQL